MTLTTRRIGLLLLIGSFYSPLFAARPAVPIEPLDFTPPSAERVVLKNGIVVYLKADHELPLIEMSLRLKTNPSLEPAPDAFELIAGAWRTGGTKTISPSEFDRLLENTATNLSLSVDHESAVLTLSSLTQNWNQAFSLATELLFEPRFQTDQVDLLKEQTLSGLRRQNESIAEIGRRAFRDVIYGPQHVYAQNPTIKTISALTRSVLMKTHAQILDPQGAVLSVSGDFDKAKMLDDLNAKLGSWLSKRTTLPSYNYSVKNPPQGALFFVEKDFTQSRIFLGRPGPARHHPDHYALRMADAIFGGGGPSRLFGEIRSRLGLAYMVGSQYTEREGLGVLAVVCQTMAPATLQATRALIKELEKFSSAPPFQDELDIAKESAINSFVFGFLTSDDIVKARASNEFYGYAPNYLETYTQRISDLSVQNILDVAKTYYRPQDWKIVVVGDSRKMGETLESLGTVVTIPLEKLD